MDRGFWDNLKYPLVGLSPMDGVTDAPQRAITAKYGKPDIVFTEFVSVDGICAGAEPLLKDFLYSEAERPVVAQVFGSDPELFYKTAPLLCELGFDGIDINMGCPDKNVAKRGGGAALILTPDNAKKIIKRTKEGIKEWSEGKDLKEFDLPENIIKAVKKKKVKAEKRNIPVSVKTRIGYDKNVIEWWVEHLLEAEPANISIHGRTLKQMYTGSADWDSISKAAAIIKKTKTSVLGNGDIASMEDAKEKIKTYGVDGVLVGRATFGNPWFFSSKIPSIEERLKVALEHAELYEKTFGGRKFHNMRKHLAWYAHGFQNSKELRMELMKAEDSKECEKIINKFISG